MKNVSFMQLVLGTAGVLLIYSGIKDVDLVGFLHELAINPKQAFNQGWLRPKVATIPGNTPNATPGMPTDPNTSRNLTPRPI